MRIFTNGARHFGSQLPRIEDGFRALGHEITPYVDAADLVYSNDSHAQVVRDRASGVIRPEAKVILTALDVPSHIPGFDYATLRAQLAAADAVCTISAFGQWQVKHYLGLDSTVIWQPVKPVTQQRGHPALTQKPEWRFMHCGRRSDPNKRFTLGVAAIQMLGYTESDLLLVGNEPGWGDHRGVLDDRGLEIAYNCVDFVLCTSHIEGLCLPVLEAMAAGVVPVVCRDMSTRAELLPPDLFPEYEYVDPTPLSIARFISTYVNDESGIRLANLKGRLHSHYEAVWRDRVSPVAVASAICSVYESLT